MSGGGYCDVGSGVSRVEGSAVMLGAVYQEWRGVL